MTETDPQLVLEGTFDLKIRRPDEDTIRLEQKNLVTGIGKTAIGSLLVGVANYSPLTHLVFGSGQAAASYDDTQLVAEAWMISCEAAGDRETFRSDDLKGFSIRLFRSTPVVYSGPTFVLNEMGAAARAAGKTAALWTRALAVTPVTIVNGTSMLPSWTLRFKEM